MRNRHLFHGGREFRQGRHLVGRGPGGRWERAVAAVGFSIQREAPAVLTIDYLNQFVPARYDAATILHAPYSPRTVWH